MKRLYFAKRVMEQVELQAERMPLLPLVELCGDKRVLVENHKGIIEYSEEKIGIAVRYGTLLIIGNHLCLHQITKFQLVICGQISTIQLLKG